MHSSATLAVRMSAQGQVAHSSVCECPKAERAQRPSDLRGLFTRWQDHRLRLQRQDAQSVGCRWSGAPNPAPVPKLSAPTLAAASLELKAEKQSAHSGNIWSVAFSPDGKTIVSGSSDKTLKVWDAGAWALIPLNPHAQN